MVAFVSNGGWIDSNTADGVRVSLADEYSRIYVYNLRGNQRTSGELSKREGGKVFGSGSRNTVAIFIGIRNPDHTGPCQIFYRDIGDYLSREQKLDIVASETVQTLDWQPVTPNTHGDWINHRSDDFTAWPPIGDKEASTRVFEQFSMGLNTAKDAWCYSFSGAHLRDHVQHLIEAANTASVEFGKAQSAAGSREQTGAAMAKFIDERPDLALGHRIKWSRNLINSAARFAPLSPQPGGFRIGQYRPFVRQHQYFDKHVNDMVYRLNTIFPTPNHTNIGFYLVGRGSDKPFSAMMTDHMPDLSFWGSGSGQFFPRWTYEKPESDSNTLDLDTGTGEHDQYGYRRVDNITDTILTLYRSAIGDHVTKDAIFFYVYGLLHSPTYRQTYAADLKKMLPHIPTPETAGRFEQLAAAGKTLADLHAGYDNVAPYPVDLVLKPGADPDARETWRVSKLKWAKRKDPATGKSVDDHTTLIYNPSITIEAIPEAAERYTLGSRSALDWIIERYQVKTDKASSIVNDPNDWCDEHDDPRYIVDLIAKVTTVAIETMKIVDSL